MAEKSIERSYWISKTHPSLRVRLHLTVEFTGVDNLGVEFRDHMNLIPLDIDLSSLSAGAIRGLTEFDYDLESRGLSITILGFEASAKLSLLTESEIKHLKRKLVLLVQEVIEDVLAEIAEPNQSLGNDEPQN